MGYIIEAQEEQIVELGNNTCLTLLYNIIVATGTTARTTATPKALRFPCLQNWRNTDIDMGQFHTLKANSRLNVYTRWISGCRNLARTIDLEIDIPGGNNCSFAVNLDICSGSLNEENGFWVHDNRISNPQVFLKQLVISQDTAVLELHQWRTSPGPASRRARSRCCVCHIGAGV